MIRFSPDWQYIRRFTLRPSLCLLVAITVLAYAAWTRDVNRAIYQQLNANHDAVYEDYDALVNQRRLIESYHRRYQQFHDLGFIGRESRLDWVETLRRTAKEQSIPRLSYSVQPQVGVVMPVNSIIDGDEVQVRVSNLQIEMGLLHELDLLRFFDAFQNKAPGLIKVDECEISFSGDQSASSSAANLSAVCAVEIFSVITSDVDKESI